MTGLPPWARFIAIIGIPGAIAFYLVWIGSQSLPAMSRDILVIKQQEEQNRAIYLDLLNEQRAVYRMMQRICANTARADSERQRCFD